MDLPEDSGKAFGCVSTHAKPHGSAFTVTRENSYEEVRLKGDFIAVQVVGLVHISEMRARSVY